MLLLLLLLLLLLVLVLVVVVVMIVVEEHPTYMAAVDDCASHRKPLERTTPDSAAFSSESTSAPSPPADPAAAPDIPSALDMAPCPSSVGSSAATCASLSGIKGRRAA